MFRAFITFLTTAMMLAHGLFGCCWHHEHGHLGEESGKSRATMPARDHQVAAHQHSGSRCHADADHDEDAKLPCPSECNAERCVFVRTTDGSAFDAGHAAAFTALISIEPSLHQVATPERNRAPSWPAAPPMAAAPLHARLNVWLI